MKLYFDEEVKLGMYFHRPLSISALQRLDEASGLAEAASAELQLLLICAKFLFLIGCTKRPDLSLRCSSNSCS